MIMTMERQLTLIALVAALVVVFAPELRDGAVFVLAKVNDANAIKLVEGQAIGQGCL